MVATGGLTFDRHDCSKKSKSRSDFPELDDSDNVGNFIAVPVYACALGEGVLTATFFIDGQEQPSSGLTHKATTTVKPKSMKRVEESKGTPWRCKGFPYGLVSVWKEVGTSTSQHVKILQGRFNSGFSQAINLPFNLHEEATCIRARFSNKSTSVDEKIMVKGSLHIVYHQLNEESLDIEVIKTMTPKTFANLYYVNPPDKDDPVLDEHIATAIKCTYCIGYTETKAVEIDYKHLKRPVLYAYGQSSNGNDTPIDMSAKWITPYRGLPSSCALNSASNHGPSGWMSLASWLLKELLFDPYVCRELYRYQFREELLEDISDPNLAEQITNELISIIFPWE